jgi:hypothetical protein
VPRKLANRFGCKINLYLHVADRHGYHLRWIAQGLHSSHTLAFHEAPKFSHIGFHGRTKLYIHGPRAPRKWHSPPQPSTVSPSASLGSSDDSQIRTGYGIRRYGSCYDNEHKNETSDNYFACYPISLKTDKWGNDESANWQCEDENTETCRFRLLVPTPSWNLWQNNGYLCCDQGQVGYITEESSHGTYGCNDMGWIRSHYSSYDRSLRLATRMTSTGK